jgi:hypothetical protein
MVALGEMGIREDREEICGPQAAGEIILWWPCPGLRQMHFAGGEEGISPLKPNGSVQRALAVKVRILGVPRFALVCGGLCDLAKAR